MYGYDEDSAFMKGYRAHLAGQSLLTNPYSELYAPEQWDEWLDGWLDADIDDVIKDEP